MSNIVEHFPTDFAIGVNCDPETWYCFQGISSPYKVQATRQLQGLKTPKYSRKQGLRALGKKTSQRARQDGLIQQGGGGSSKPLLFCEFLNVSRFLSKTLARDYLQEE
ncbi:hypothetical protein JTE90_026244 [Oedothorax gibbosus]|uniref:Uncharacterized protein n=1 Tax=Oedothorax gibbosus TaxID=931172 RepID=A0AAV6U6G1_9ARAC|nr:hypothetical protein JTE90_026244 [Oedothorax gibbosus]